METWSAIGRRFQRVAPETTLLYIHFKGGVEELCEYPPDDSSEENRADPHTGAGWHTLVASTLPLVIFEPHILNGKQDPLLEFVLHPFRARSGMSLGLLELQTKTRLGLKFKQLLNVLSQKKVILLRMTSKHQFSIAPSCWRNKVWLRQGRKFLCSQRHRGWRRWEKESEWYYKYCLVRQGWLETTFINIMERLEETEDSHDLHAITDGGRSVPFPLYFI